MNIAKGYCQCGCGRKTRIISENNKTRGLVKGEPFRFLHGHNNHLDRLTRFYTNFSVGKPDECWEWTGGRNSHGYGHFENHNASRVAYEIAFGHIAKHLYVLHKCDNPPCVNPNHLYLGTQSDNIKDMRDKGRAKGNTTHGSENVNSILNESKVSLIRRRHQAGESLASLGRRYNMHISTIWQIVHRKTWKHVL